MRSGVKLADGTHSLLVQRYDNKGQNEEALAVLRFQIDDGVTLIAQCNPSPYCDDADEGDQGRTGR